MNMPTQIQAHPGYLPFFASAAERTLRQFIEAFWFEGALNGHLELQSDGTAKLHLMGINENNQNIEYQIVARQPGAFKRARLLGPLRESRTGRVIHDVASAASHLLRHLAVVTTEEQTRRFITELTHTATKQAYSMDATNLPALNLPYAQLEARLGDGHLYHPCYRSRMGFSLADHQRYGPEFAQAFSLVWLAVEKHLCDIHAIPGLDYEHFLQQELGSDELTRLRQVIEQQDHGSADYYLLPVHPWHWQHSLQIHYAHWLAEGSLLFLGEGATQWLAQQSIRSLSSLAADACHHIKLPLSIANSSADRILSDHHVYNAPLISTWLQNICQQDTYLQYQARLVIVTEPIGITLKPGIAHKDNYGLLGAIWRAAPETMLQEGEQVFPCTGLTTSDQHQQLCIAPWLKRHGTAIWVKALLTSMLGPFLHLMIKHGVLLEAHAQNTLLILKDGLPVGVAIRDLPGGLHYIAGRTTDEDLIEQLRQAPAHRNAANASNGFTMHLTEARDYLLEVLLFIHLSELAHRLELLHDFSEQQFWQLASQAVQEYQAQVPELATSFTEFDLFVPELNIECLATRRLLASTSQQFHAVPNPLHQHSHQQQNRHQNQHQSQQDEAQSR